MAIAKNGKVRVILMPVRHDFEVQTIASGSSGNLAIVRFGATVVLLDLGLRAQRDYGNALAKAGLASSDVSAALVSHRHSDHLNYAGLRWCALSKIPVLAGISTRNAAYSVYSSRIQQSLPDGILQVVRPDVSYQIKDLVVTPFEVPHDVETFGYVFEVIDGGATRRMTVATDLGHAPAGLEERFAGASTVVLEANYNERMLKKSPRNPVDKARVASNVGHLSNTQSGQFLRRIAEYSGQAPSRVVLVHLSQDHNTTQLALDEVREASGLRENTTEFIASPRKTPGVPCKIV